MLKTEIDKSLIESAVVAASLLIKMEKKDWAVGISRFSLSSGEEIQELVINFGRSSNVLKTSQLDDK